MEIQKIEYLENEKRYLNETKNIFHGFWRAIIWWKIKIWSNIVDTMKVVEIFTSIVERQCFIYEKR